MPYCFHLHSHESGAPSVGALSPLPSLSTALQPPPLPGAFAGLVLPPCPVGLLLGRYFLTAWFGSRLYMNLDCSSAPSCVTLSFPGFKIHTWTLFNTSCGAERRHSKYLWVYSLLKRRCLTWGTWEVHSIRTVGQTWLPALTPPLSTMQPAAIPFPLQRSFGLVEKEDKNSTLW